MQIAELLYKGMAMHFTFFVCFYSQCVSCGSAMVVPEGLVVKL